METVNQPSKPAFWPDWVNKLAPFILAKRHVLIKSPVAARAYETPPLPDESIGVSRLQTIINQTQGMVDAEREENKKIPAGRIRKIDHLTQQWIKNNNVILQALGEQETLLMEVQDTLNGYAQKPAFDFDKRDTVPKIIKEVNRKFGINTNNLESLLNLGLVSLTTYKTAMDAVDYIQTSSGADENYFDHEETENDDVQRYTTLLTTSCSEKPDETESEPDDDGFETTDKESPDETAYDDDDADLDKEESVTEDEKEVQRKRLSV